MDISLAPILLVLVVSVTAVQSQITKGPANALKKLNDSVTLECVTNSSNCDEVVWEKMEGAQSPKTVYQNGAILDSFRDIDLRYNVSSTGGCSLTIAQLQLSDSGRFSCKQVVGDREEKKSCILVVISVRESEACQLNLENNTLNQNDVYIFSTAINVPAKSVEPSNVTLSFQDTALYETERMDGGQPLIVKTTLTGTARTGIKNITQRVCRASLHPITVDGFDRSTATLDICNTQQLIVSYSVENIAVSPPGPYYKDSRVTCTAKGYPPPTFNWTNLKSGEVVDGDTLVITGEAGYKYTCTATNIVKGKPTSLSITIEVSPPEPGCGPGCIGGIIGGIIGGVVAIAVIGVVSFFVYNRFCRQVG